VTINSNYPP